MEVQNTICLLQIKAMSGAPMHWNSNALEQVSSWSCILKSLSLHSRAVLEVAPPCMSSNHICLSFGMHNTLHKSFFSSLFTISMLQAAQKHSCQARSHLFDCWSELSPLQMGGGLPTYALWCLMPSSYVLVAHFLQPS